MTGPLAPSLQPPASAGQIGEIQAVMWLLYSACQPQSRRGHLGSRGGIRDPGAGLPISHPSRVCAFRWVWMEWLCVRYSGEAELQAFLCLYIYR